MDDPNAMLKSINLHAKVRDDCSRHPTEVVNSWQLERSRLWRLRSPWWPEHCPLVVTGDVLKSPDRMRTAILNWAEVLLPPEFDKWWPELLVLLLGKVVHCDC